MSAVLNRFKEPSSYAGIAALAAVVAPNLDSGVVQHLTAILAALAGLASFFMREKGSK